MVSEPKPKMRLVNYFFVSSCPVPKFLPLLLGNHVPNALLWLLTHLRCCTSLGLPWSMGHWVP